MDRTNDDWKTIIDSAVTNLTASYPVPVSEPPVDIHTLPSYIDHTLLSLDATPEQIDTLCKEAKEYKFKASVSYIVSSNMDYLTFFYRQSVFGQTIYPAQNKISRTRK
jgi:hypothetical protein